MATLIIRGFPDNERDRLRRQAVASGRSMEAEARRLLLEGLAKQNRLTSDAGQTISPGASKKSAPKDWLKKVQALVAKNTKKRAPGDLMSEQFLRERRAMWDEE